MTLKAFINFNDYSYSLFSVTVDVSKRIEVFHLDRLITTNRNIYFKIKSASQINIVNSHVNVC